MKQRGFTLIELMIVIAIIGILASIAMPSYRDYVRKSNMTEIVTLVNALAQKQQLYYNENGVWASAALSNDVLGVTARTDFSTDAVEQAFIANRRGDGQVYVLTRAGALGVRNWVRFNMEDVSGLIRGSYCNPDDPTVAELAQYLPEGEC
ncbi:MAG: prepilin-type N-terminal cleavage/methylation domain-containing protein [Pseudomonadota bacterium]